MTSFYKAISWKHLSPKLRRLLLSDACIDSVWPEIIKERKRLSKKMTKDLKYPPVKRGKL